MAERTSRTANAHTKRGRTKKRDWKPDFLAAFEEEMTITAACQAVKIGRSTAYEARKGDPKFAEAWDELDHMVTETLEREAYRRAVEGVDTPMVSAGKLVVTTKTYSDGLLMFLLKARNAGKYRENVKVEHTGKIDGPPTVVIAPAPDRELQVAKMLAEAGAVSDASRN